MCTINVMTFRAPSCTMKDQRWDGGLQIQLYSSFNLGARWSGVVNATPPSLYHAKMPCTHRPKAGRSPESVQTCEETLVSKVIRYLERTAHSKSLYRLRYPGQQSGHGKIKYVLLMQISNQKRAACRMKKPSWRPHIALWFSKIFSQDSKLNLHELKTVTFNVIRTSVLVVTDGIKTSFLHHISEFNKVYNCTCTLQRLGSFCCKFHILKVHLKIEFQFLLYTCPQPGI